MIILCLGAEVALNLTPKAAYHAVACTGTETATTPRNTDVGASHDQTNGPSRGWADQSVQTDEIMQEADDGGGETTCVGSEARIPVAEDKAKKTSVPRLTLTMVHGDSVILTGDDYMVGLAAFLGHIRMAQLFGSAVSGGLGPRCVSDRVF